MMGGRKTGNPEKTKKLPHLRPIIENLLQKDREQPQDYFENTHPERYPRRRR